MPYNRRNSLKLICSRIFISTCEMKKILLGICHSEVFAEVVYANNLLNPHFILYNKIFYMMFSY